MQTTLNATLTPEPRRFDRRDPEGDARMRYILGLPVRVTMTPIETWVSTPRAFVASEPSRASCRVRPITRSHRHHAESEA